MATTLSKKYQVVVPKEVRTRMRLRTGETVALYPLDEERALLVKHPADPLKALRGLGKDVWRSLGGTRKYIRSERKSWLK
ncbi:hypothetical protein A3A39_01695 [Candidatus Kaiserbacteria bacterium RIFCSPLOWO2_01_FULL_54_13]|uniref:SpoVT-AbrB domain-containing protein n=1 Tax=Candidatus Kaiserbacteria bacterium RIFCSPLOWO2_01_FULL_54_13 TaxID=1798512 RepID=A0A1F6F1C8_9BACT|nr:MAG: hypothetical protein A3A39_01695 [Candidatus Kaiserbacteria bacterium RIFCSPLOWO2_01_FULL_54_13]